MSLKRKKKKKKKSLKILLLPFDYLGNFISLYTLNSPKGYICKYKMVGKYEFPKFESLYCKKASVLFGVIYKGKMAMFNTYQAITTESTSNTSVNQVLACTITIPYCMTAKASVPSLTSTIATSSTTNPQLNHLHELQLMDQNLLQIRESSLLIPINFKFLFVFIQKICI